MMEHKRNYMQNTRIYDRPRFTLIERIFIGSMIFNVVINIAIFTVQLHIAGII